MKAAAFYECGGPEKIKTATVPDPQIKASQVLVKVKACGLNHFDLLVLRGPVPDYFPFPYWGGADIAGEVIEIGDTISSFKTGDRVVVNPGLFCGKCEFCIAGEESLCANFGIIGDDIQGGCAEFVAVNESNIIKLPDSLSYEEAAAVPLVFQTAWRALISRAKLRAGEDILILGSSGGVASAAIQIAKLIGARVIAVTSSPEKIEKTRKLGADICLNRNDGDYWAAISKLTDGRGIDVVLDSIGATTLPQSLKSLVKGGRLVTIGRTTGRLAEIDIRLVFWHQLQLLGSSMSNRKEFSDVMRLVFQKRLNPVIDSVFSLEQARNAYERLDAGEQFGKVIIRVGE